MKIRRLVLVGLVVALALATTPVPEAHASLNAATLVESSRRQFRQLANALENIRALRAEFDVLTDGGSDTQFLQDYFTANPELDISFATFVQAFVAIDDINATLDASGDVTLPTRSIVREKAIFAVASNR